jgi:hypothetical protein
VATAVTPAAFAVAPLKRMRNGYAADDPASRPSTKALVVHSGTSVCSSSGRSSLFAKA